MTLHIHNIHDLQRAGRLASWLHRPSISSVEVGLPWLDEHERRRVGRVLTRSFNDCGCLWGAPAFIGSLLACLVWAPWQIRQLWLEIGVSLPLAVAAALTAKVIALAWSRWRLKTVLARMQREWVIRNA
jgi:hypothetical protein